MTAPIRQGIYYWKCDRPAAFHGTAQGAARRPGPELLALIAGVITRHFGQAPTVVREGVGQGNHATFVAEVAGQSYFVRVEDGPEQDDYMTVESEVMARLRALGVPTPRLFATEATRRAVPFAWQIMELVAEPDLNRSFKAGTLETDRVAEQLGRLIATWQAVPVEGFGPFDVGRLRTDRTLHGLHSSYAGYFFIRLDAHLAFLVEREFLAPARAAEIRAGIESHRSLLDLQRGCLVHKDIALWNVLGTENKITAVIDWDDCIAGDPMDDLALLACFHDGAFLRRAFTGYAAVRPLPVDHVARFWLHLLRNMIFKAVIRVGAGYFKLDGGFFLIGAAGTGSSLREQTLSRIDSALHGLRENRDPFTL
ncbi:MAG: aminoglycoside phosphotransferase family protein [Opitutus sp.]|nr:aminoglycoside phosphotransferase family protein [Opitutus sp.]